MPRFYQLCTLPANDYSPRGIITAVRPEAYLIIHTSGSVWSSRPMEAEAGRPTWSRQIEFTLAGIGCAVGLGNIWRFPYLCYRSGGGAFLLPYLLMLVVLGIPLLHMELTLGQHLRRGPVLALSKACPLLKGVGMATVAISFIMSTYYNIIITWALYYMFSSFRSNLLWENCNNTWNTVNCTDTVTNSSSSSTASQQFFNYKVLERTSGVEETGTLRWELFLLLMLGWILVYLCIFKGVKSTGKVWINAAAQIFNSIGIGFGSLMAMASYNSYNNNVLKDTLAISITNSLTSIFAGFVIFSAFGYMSHLQNVPVSEIAVDGPGLVFVVYPQAFVTMPVAPLWAILFFFMLLCLGLDSQVRVNRLSPPAQAIENGTFWFAMVEVMVTSLLDSYSKPILKYLKHKEFLVLVVGIYVFQLMDHYTAIVSIMFLAFFEVLGVCWLYGVKRLSSNLIEMTGKKPNIFFRICWWVICPALITVILVFSVIQFKPARYEDYVYPPWAQGVGWLIALASIIWIPLGALHTLWVLPGSITEVLCNNKKKMY
ncbi:hypothetical protein DNTS_003317 [Danionella cerebrum]|uniref:Transporter n=1 Tax=Danionella cerebrum TaxID=2873325 RepID=A0A553MVQ7_9TELE|nr:hypothetical protein DNTS_003317 [Danionella translucida]